MISNDIFQAIRTLTPPDENQAKAADARQEIDLRIGCAFTRFQTLLIRNHVLGVDSVVSYGPCQFPTLGFVVERYLQRTVSAIDALAHAKNFVPEPFWFIQASILAPDPTAPAPRVVKLNWARNRVFDQLVAVTLYSLIADEKEGTVIKYVRRLRLPL